MLFSHFIRLKLSDHSMHKTRILLVDDHQLVRAGFRSLLTEIPSVQVVAEANDGYEALNQLGKYRPDLVLMDIAMPRLNGLEAVARASKEFPNTKVIVLSMHANEEYVVQALRAGASGYLIKDAAVGELARAIRAVMAGETYFSTRFSRRAIESYLVRIGGNRGPLEQLTPRQREIVQLIAEGNNTKEIAFLLRVSVKTIEAHRTQLMRRLGINNIPSLVRYAMRTGLVPAEGPVE
jgi:DNA-binding NarL/FixJ family response regulator